MKKKTISKVIAAKFEDWLSTITDKSVQKLIKENSIVTGGAIASMLLREPVNDFDVYFTNKETVKAVANYYVKAWNDANSDTGYVLDGADIKEEDLNSGRGLYLNMTPDRIKVVFSSRGVAKEPDLPGTLELEGEEPIISDIEDGKPKYRPIYLSSNAITLSQKIQIVLRFWGDPANIHQHYDYIHCTNYWLSKTKELTLNQPALEALLSKELRYIGSKYPIASVIRTRKFIKRNWTINAGQYLKMAFQISELNLKDMAVLEDQLTGVDVSYFEILLEALQNKIEADKNFIIDYSYLSLIIDKIF